MSMSMSNVCQCLMSNRKIFNSSVHGQMLGGVHMHGAILSVHLIGSLGVDHGVGACQYPKYIVPYLFDFVKNNRARDFF